MIVTKKTFTDEALKHVEFRKDYDKDEVVSRTAIEMANQLHEAIGFGSMSIESISKLREIFMATAPIAIDWRRLNRKAHPEEYADTMKDGAWPHPMIGGEL